MMRLTFDETGPDGSRVLPSRIAEVRHDSPIGLLFQWNKVAKIAFTFTDGTVRTYERQS